MKKLFITLMIAAIAAGAAYADKEKGKQDGNRKQDRAWGEMGNRGQMGRPDGPNRESMELMHAHFVIIRDLGERARAETDEAQKAELVAELRKELNITADLMEANQAKRLAKATARLEKLESRLEEAKANRDQMIEDRLQRILSGEGPGPRGDGEGRRDRGGKGRGDGEGRRGSGMGGGPRDGSGPNCSDDTPAAPADEEAPVDEEAPPPTE